VDYPDYVKKAIHTMREQKIPRGIILCGTGIGTTIASNKYKGIRAALCFNEYSARMSRRHNDANILCMGQRVVGEPFALEIARAWLETEYEGGRHDKRLKKVTDIEAVED
jgi:ribose 5-phosphate isomerase B